MPTCQNCHNKWSWKQTFRKSFTLDTGIPCPYCGEKQFLTSKSRKRSTLGILLIPFLIFVPNFFDFSLLATLSIYAGYVILFSFTYPFLIELSNREEALW
ncbi:TIGR04104 family putative zinc finger protein [Virgibacillus oceani]